MNKVKKGEQGYTLLEILAVLTLMAFIITLVAPNIVKQLQSGQQKAVKTQINSTMGILNQYYLDNSAYPTTEQGLKALLEKPGLPPVPENWNGPYIASGKLPRDPWNRDLKYACPGAHNTSSYDLFSYGQNGVEGGTGADADVGNW